MSLSEGRRRLAVRLGVIGAIVGVLASCVGLSAVLIQKAQHNIFERLANSQAVEQEHKALQVPRLSPPEKLNEEAAMQFNLARTYEIGQGRPQDSAQAAAWYRKAAEQGHAEAQFNLGVLYDGGQGVPQDYAQAAMWYRKAAAQNLANADYGLGVLYNDGHGVPQSYPEAYCLFDMAVLGSTGNEKVTAAQSRDFVVGKLTPQELSAVQGRAAQWLVTDSGPTTGVLPDMSKSIPLPSIVMKEGIKAIFWRHDDGVELFETDDGEMLYPTQEPSAWKYLLIALFPVLGFFIPWGAVRALG